MLSANSILIRFGERTLFDGVSFTVSPHDRIGLVGSNGSGKTTLLKAIAGTQELDGGSIQKASFVTVGYLPQDGVSAAGRTLSAEAHTAFEDVLSVQRSLAQAQRDLAQLSPESPEAMELLEVVGELQHRLEDLDVYRLESKVERVLMGLGFSVGDLTRQTEEFSGGWQMRIELAKLLLREPSVLLLDEPTNHLDIDSQLWLEDYLRSYDGAVILVSHDRAFLDTITRTTLALTGGKAEQYSGNYSFYVRESQARKLLLEQAFKNQQKEIQKTQEFIDRFRYKNTKARQVQSRIKRLEKLDRIEIETDESGIVFRFPQAPPSGRKVIELLNIEKRYGALTVFSGLTCLIERGERIAIVGVNGAGKSTFARIVAGTEDFDGGERIVGHNVSVSYFAQHQAEELDPEKDALETLDEIAVGDIRRRLRTILGSFLFHGDDVFKKVSVLSGGEKSRLALAKMLLAPSNLLILDEPTNHLDMRSKGVLQAALDAYEGTLVIVSHDRAFLDPLVTKVLEFSPAGMKVYLGTVSEYLQRKAEERERIAARDRASDGTSSDEKLSARERRRQEAEERQERSKRLKPVKERIAKVERSISTLEARKKELEHLMADPDFFTRDEQAKRAPAEYKRIESDLAYAYREWEELSEKLTGEEQ